MSFMAFCERLTEEVGTSETAIVGMATRLLSFKIEVVGSETGDSVSGLSRRKIHFLSPAFNASQAPRHAKPRRSTTA
jgi:hypothetical protein